MRLGIVFIVLSALSSALATKWHFGNPDPCWKNSECLNQHSCITRIRYVKGVYTGGGGKCGCGSGLEPKRCGQCIEKPLDKICALRCPYPSRCANNGGNLSCICPVSKGYIKRKGGICEDPCEKNGKPCSYPKTCYRTLLEDGRYSGPRQCQCPMGYKEENGTCKNLCEEGPCHKTATCFIKLAREANGINGMCQCPSGTTGNPSKNGAGCRSLCTQSCEHNKECQESYMTDGTIIYRCLCPFGQTDGPDGICVEGCQPPCSEIQNCETRRNWTYTNEIRYDYICTCKYGGYDKCLTLAEYHRRDSCGNRCRADQQCDRQNLRSPYKCFCPCGQKDDGAKCVQEN